jgi:hypothetical protein
MNRAALEARLMGLRHQPGCPADRVEAFDAARPGRAGPPRAIEIIDRRGKPVGTREVGPALLEPPKPLRVARCLDCAAQAIASQPAAG